MSLFNFRRKPPVATHPDPLSDAGDQKLTLPVKVEELPAPQSNRVKIEDIVLGVDYAIYSSAVCLSRSGNVYVKEDTSCIKYCDHTYDPFDCYKLIKTRFGLHLDFIHPIGYHCVTGKLLPGTKPVISERDVHLGRKQLVGFLSVEDYGCEATGHNVEVSPAVALLVREAEEKRNDLKDGKEEGIRVTDIQAGISYIVSAADLRVKNNGAVFVSPETRCRQVAAEDASTDEVKLRIHKGTTGACAISVDSPFDITREIFVERRGPTEARRKRTLKSLESAKSKLVEGKYDRKKHTICLGTSTAMGVLVDRALYIRSNDQEAKPAEEKAKEPTEVKISKIVPRKEYVIDSISVCLSKEGELFPTKNATCVEVNYADKNELSYRIWKDHSTDKHIWISVHYPHGYSSVTGERVIGLETEVSEEDVEEAKAELAGELAVKDYHRCDESIAMRVCLGVRHLINAAKEIRAGWEKTEPESQEEPVVEEKPAQQAEIQGREHHRVRLEHLRRSQGGNLFLVKQLHQAAPRPENKDEYLILECVNNVWKLCYCVVQGTQDEVLAKLNAVPRTALPKEAWVRVAVTKEEIQKHLDEIRLVSCPNTPDQRVRLNDAPKGEHWIDLTDVQLTATGWLFARSSAVVFDNKHSGDGRRLKVYKNEKGKLSTNMDTFGGLKHINVVSKTDFEQEIEYSPRMAQVFLDVLLEKDIPGPSVAFANSHIYGSKVSQCALTTKGKLIPGFRVYPAARSKSDKHKFVWFMDNGGGPTLLSKLG